MKKIIILFFLTLNIYGLERYELMVKKELLYKAKVVLNSQVGVKELTGNNDGYEVNLYQKAAGIRQGNAKVKGDPYCMAGLYFCYYRASECLALKASDIPFPRTGSSQVPFDFARRNGKKTSFYPKENDFFVWKQRNAYQGHIGFITKVTEKGWVTTIEFNTSSGSSGSQRDGGGVYIRRRNYLHPLGSMLVRGFVGFKTI